MAPRLDLHTRLNGEFERVRKFSFPHRVGWTAVIPQLIMGLVVSVLALTTLGDAQTRAGGPREKLFDFYQRLIPQDSHGLSPFHIVEIDHESIQRIGPWPWPRSVIAELVDNAAAAGATGVIYVEPVDAPDPLSTTTITNFWLEGARGQKLADEFAALPSTDETLAKALNAANGAFAIDPAPPAFQLGQLSLGQLSLDKAALPADNITMLDTPNGATQYISLPISKPRFGVNEAMNTAAQLSVTTLPLDGDGVFRAAPLLWSVDGTAKPSIALQAARLANKESHFTVLHNSAAMTDNDQIVRAIKLGAKTLPVDQFTRAAVLWPQRPMPTATAAWRLHTAATSNTHLAGKVVLIGRDTKTGAAIPTPNGALSPAALHTTIAEQILQGAVQNRPIWMGYIEALSVIALGMIVIIFTRSISFWYTLGLAALGAIVLFLFSGGLLYVSNYVFDPLPGVLALGLGALSAAGGGSFGAAFSDEQLRNNFKLTLPEQTLKKIREDGPKSILDGSRREITILACELTLLDEDLKCFAGKPGAVTSMVASACQSVRQAIVEMGGATDQSDGGKVFGYFNAPFETADHVKAACLSALRLIELMDKINAQIDGGRSEHDIRLHLAIGISSGECLVGPMGHGRTNRYSAIGEPMRMASFLSRQAAYYGPAIIVNDEIFRSMRHNFAFLELDRVQPRGRARSSAIHALVGSPFLKSGKSFRALDEAHRDMLAAYRAGELEKAEQTLAQIRDLPGSNIALFDIYEQRIKDAQENGLPVPENGATPVTI